MKNKKFIPFRAKLVLFAFLIVLIIGLPVLYFEVQRPWQVLHSQIELSDTLLGSVHTTINKNDLELMNTYALTLLEKGETLTPEEHDYYDMSFNMLLLKNTLLSEEEMDNTLKQNIPHYHKVVDYEAVKKSYDFWQGEESNHPQEFILFRKYKQYLVTLKKEIHKTGFKVADVYILLDSGKKTGFFEKNIAFLLDGYDWWNSSFPGEGYDAPSSSNLRDLSLANQTGYSHNQEIDQNHFFMPQFYKDEWGEWFSVWLTDKNSDVFDSFVVDFDAKRIQTLMAQVISAILFIGFLVLVVITITTERLSLSYSRSPEELKKGIKEVSSGNYKYMMPKLADEFGKVRDDFNSMTLRLQERDRLLQVLERLLSKEMAAEAAKSGLALGGEEVGTTIMFTDFAGFSTITQNLHPRDVVDALNSYFEVMVPIIKNHGGFPDKYIGDAIVAIFGAPIKLSDHAERAVQCAIEMQEAIQKLNEQRRKDGEIIFEMRIGLNSGDVLAGTIGCDMKLEYTTIGETTNLANRMEAGCRIGDVMISHRTYTKLPRAIIKSINVSKDPEPITVKGYNEPIQAYHILVSLFNISKNQTAKEPEDFYQYKKRGRES